MLAQDSYDEEKLVAHHAGAGWVKHLAVNKRYLYELVLKELYNFGQKKVEDQVIEKINATKVLIEKGLFPDAFRELKKAQKIAYKYELFELEIMLLSIEKRLISRRKIKRQREENIQEIFQLESHCLEQLRNANEYWLLAQSIARLQIHFQGLENEEQKKALKKIVESPLFLDFSLATNFKSKAYYFQANAAYQFILGKPEKAYEINTRFLDTLEAEPQFLKLYAERYLATLNNMLIDSLLSGKLDNLETGIDRLEQTAERPAFKGIRNIKARVFRQKYLLLLNWSLSQKDFRKAQLWIPEIEKGLSKYGRKIEKHHRITFYYLVAYLLFRNRDFDKAVHWNHLILSDRKEDVVKEIFYFARILNLMIQYELGNHKYLDSLLVSTAKYLSKRRDLYQTEKELIKFLRKYTYAANKKEKQSLVKEFATSVDSLKKVPTEQRVFNYLDLSAWLQESFQ